MSERIINTRISLGNDDLSAWQMSSDITPMKGEFVFAKRPDDSFDVRIGDGERNWNELSTSLQFEANQVRGLSSAILNVTTQNTKVLVRTWSKD